MHVIPACRRLRQEDCKFEASLDYIARPCPRKKKEKKNCPLPRNKILNNSGSIQEQTLEY
jgi:hypothetical protein